MAATLVAERETSLCDDDEVTSTSRTPTIIGDDYFITYRLDSPFKIIL